jgi:hypothetical protein
MTESEAPPAASPPAPKLRRQPSAAARWVRKSREMRVLDALKSGASLEAIAQQEGVTPRRMRDIVNALLATHEGLEPADGSTQMRKRRLDQALDAAIGEMHSGNSAGIGQFIRILSEFDRNAEIGDRRAPKQA